jgi:UDP-glucose 4-epimerase
MNKEKILITGGSGFVGTNIISELSTDTYDIYSLDIEEPKKIIEKIKYINMDIRSEDIQSLLKKINPEIIVHLAAQASVAISSRDPILDNDINLNGSLNLFLNTINSSLNKFIFFSTGGAIYGEEIGKKFNENDLPRPLSPYGISKFNFENYLNYFSSKRISKSEITILRPGNIYGPWQNPDGEAGVISIFAKKMLNNENISIFGSGDEYRDYVYVDDVIDFIFKTINLNVTGTYNLASGISTKTIEIFENISDILGYKNKPMFYDKREGDIFGIELDNSKSMSIGWSANTNLKSGLINTINFLKDL